MVKIKTSLLTSFAVIIGLTILLSVFLIVIYSNIESKYRAISETMILEYRITETFSQSVNSYAALLKDINNKNQRTTYDTANKTLDGIYKSLNSAIVSPQSIEIYTRIKNMTASVISDCNGNLSDLSKGDFSQGTGVYDRAMRGKDYVQQNTASLILKELQYSEALQAQLLLFRTLTLIASFILILLIVAGSSIFAIVYSNKLSDTLLKLSSTAEDISKGDLNLGVSADLLARKDEIGSLSNSFSTMLQQLKERINNESREKKNVERLLADSQTLQQVIREERDRARGIVSSMGEGLLVIDKDLKLVLMNPAAERFLEVRAASR